MMKHSESLTGHHLPYMLFEEAVSAVAFSATLAFPPSPPALRVVKFNCRLHFHRIVLEFSQSFTTLLAHKLSSFLHHSLAAAMVARNSHIRMGHPLVFLKVAFQSDFDVAKTTRIASFSRRPTGIYHSRFFAVPRGTTANMSAQLGGSAAHLAACRTFVGAEGRSPESSSTGTDFLWDVICLVHSCRNRVL